MFSTVLMLSIIQGLYILREDEGEELEKRQNKKKRNQQKNDPGAKKKRRPDEETERRKKSGSRNDGQGTRQKYREQPDEFERRIGRADREQPPLVRRQTTAQGRI